MLPLKYKIVIIDMNSTASETRQAYTQPPL